MTDETIAWIILAVTVGLPTLGLAIGAFLGDVRDVWRGKP